MVVVGVVLVVLVVGVVDVVLYKITRSSLSLLFHCRSCGGRRCGTRSCGCWGGGCCALGKLSIAFILGEEVREVLGTARDFRGNAAKLGFFV